MECASEQNTNVELPTTPRRGALYSISKCSVAPSQVRIRSSFDRGFMRLLIAAVCCVSLTAFGADDPKKSTAKNSKATAAPVGPKAGVKTPGIQIPFESLKSEADIAIDMPGAAVMSGSILIPSKSKDQILRVDAKTNKPPEPKPKPKPEEKMGKPADAKPATPPEPTPTGPIADIKQPCSGLVNAFGSFWIPSCGSQSLVRVDPKTLKITATISTGVADVQNGIVATADSVWLFTDSKTTLTRIDPVTNKVVDQLRLPANCDDLASGENSLWVTCPSETASCASIHRRIWWTSALKFPPALARLRSAQDLSGCCANAMARSIASIPRPIR